jgi:hypothetical protein
MSKSEFRALILFRISDFDIRIYAAKTIDDKSSAWRGKIRYFTAGSEMLICTA